MNRQESRQITRQKLRKSAMSIFAEQGIGGSSIDRICEQAGYSRGAFYANYPDKHTLALEILTEWQDRELEIWLQEVDGVEDPAVRVHMLGDAFTAFHSNRERALLAMELQLEAVRTPAFGEQYNAYLDHLHGAIAKLLTLLFKRARRVPPSDVLTLAQIMRSTALGLAIQANSRGDGDGPARAGAMLAQFIETMLKAGAVEQDAAQPPAPTA